MLSTMASYTGALLGFFNKVVLLTHFFDTAQVGLINLLSMLSMMFAQLALLGAGNATVKFFPYFKDKDRGHHGLLGFLLVVAAAGFLLLSVIFLIFKEPILSHFSRNSALLVEYYYHIFIIGLAFLLFNVFLVFLRSLYKTSVASFTRDVVLRLGVTGCITVYILGWVDFNQFVWLFTGVNVAATFVLVIYLIWLRQFFIVPRLTFRLKKLSRRILVYMVIALLGYSSYLIVQSVDAIMVADMVDLSAAGVFTTMIFLSTFILMPGRALNAVSAPRIAEFWKENDVKGIEKLYKRTSLLNMAMGTFIFLEIWLNCENFLGLMKPQYLAGYWPLFYLGLAKLLDMITGLNTFIIITSRVFKYDLIFTTGLIGVSIVLNIWLIGLMGTTGAAVATLISSGLFNLIRVAFIYYHFRIHPFTKEMLMIIGVAALIIVSAFLLPSSHGSIPVLLLKGVAVASVFWGVIYFSGVSGDINSVISKALGKIGLRLPERGGK